MKTVRRIQLEELLGSFVKGRDDITFFQTEDHPFEHGLKMATIRKGQIQTPLGKALLRFNWEYKKVGEIFSVAFSYPSTGTYLFMDFDLFGGGQKYWIDAQLKKSTFFWDKLLPKKVQDIALENMDSLASMGKDTNIVHIPRNNSYLTGFIEMLITRMRLDYKWSDVLESKQGINPDPQVQTKREEESRNFEKYHTLWDEGLKNLAVNYVGTLIYPRRD